MAKVASEEKVKVYWLPTVASKAAPTVANIAAGTNLTPFVPTDGIDISPSQNNASISMIDSGFTAEQVGTYGYAITLTLTRDDVGADDDAWALFERGLRGYLLVSRFGAPVATSRVEVYPCEAHDPAPVAPAENDFQKMTVMLAVHDTPEIKAVVAA